ncbi:hypothetical protein FRB95_004208 [Tulasnella sp. JGI-2019a]|nr:hypothetical protein FRB95_004208 [Tulasnella sp. JGI-2019a]
MKSPLPQPLPQECIKAAKIFRSFITSGHKGLDKVIPGSVLRNAKGFAIFTVVKAGFFVSARAGSGVVIARLEDGSFTAPSAIGTAGVGFGGQAGAEVTDFLVILNSQAAVKTFMSAGSLSLGGNMSLAVGPLGRTGEASGALNTKGKVAAMYSYSKTKGLFGGVSLEGSVIVERQDANAIAYNADVSAKQLLSGNIRPPYWADILIEALELGIGDTTPGWKPPTPDADAGIRPRGGNSDEFDSYDTPRNASREYVFTGIGSRSNTPSLSKKDSVKSRKKSSSLSGSIIPTMLRRKSVVGQDDNERGSPFEDSTFTHDSPVAVDPPFNPPSSKGPVRVPFDGFADGIDDDPWGDRLRPTAPPQSMSQPISPPPATTARFPTHFESDFDSTYNNPFTSKNEVSRPRSATVGPDPFPDLTTSVKAWSLSPATSERLQGQPTGPDRTRSTSPFYRGKKSSTHAWAEKPMYNRSNSRTPSYRSDSPPTPPSSAASHMPVTTTKPPRPLSVKPGVDRPPPPGALKAVALFDYNASEV